MELSQIIKQPEGRRLEFKSTAPTNSDHAKTAVAFANDAGGEIFIGINDNPQEIVGIEEDEMLKIEEQISNMIYDRCYPHILPETTFMSENGKNLICIKIYKGNMPPYYIKKDGKVDGTYVRVGSNNRLADAEILMELERKRMNIPFDGELVYEKKVEEIDITSFQKLYKEKTEEDVDIQVLKKLDLVKEEQGSLYPTNALILFSDDDLKHSHFPNAKVSCARFKGTSVDEFIDQKVFSGNICIQAEEAYNFVLRNVNKNAHVEGVYTVSRWEYPIKAIREVIRNAVVHRQYSLTGKDISDELKLYPEIDFVWREVGLSFQIQFVKKNVEKDNDYDVSLDDVRENVSENIIDNVSTQNVLAEIEKDIRIGVDKIAENLALTPRHCWRIIAILKQQGILKRVGTKKGYWIIEK
ncbi:MAG: putative DNA binding domain-containing protein [Bacteroidales bacterium]|nr:putative DNA binding domain-containing protein [Bacteroidales bacterium]